jgi:hypothetical protein
MYKNTCPNLPWMIMIKVCQAKFQADSALSEKMMSWKSDILMTSDPDQAALLGEECQCIKSFVFKDSRQGSTLDDIEIFTAFKSTIETVTKYINFPLDKIKIAKFPVFDEMYCCKMRALVAVGLGCDVNLRNIVTPKPLLTYLQSQPTTITTTKAYQGSFVVDKGLDNETKIGLLEILAELVKVYKKPLRIQIQLTHCYQI